MNKEIIDHIIARDPKLKSARHTLELMQPGAFCIHRSWGFGEIKYYDEVTNRLIIDFKEEGKESHPMDPAFCIGKLHILDDNDILVRQQKEPDTLDEMIRKQPVEVVVEILASKPEGTASAAELERYLNYLLGAKYKKWWTQTKKLLLKDPRIAVPIKKTDPYILRDEPLTPEQEILEEFYANKNPKKKILLAEKLYQLSESVVEIANDLPQILEELTSAIKNAKQLNDAERIHGIWVRNDLCRHLCEDVETLEPTSGSILHKVDNLSELAEDIPYAYHNRLLDLVQRTFPEDWETRSIQLLKYSVGKFTNECISFLMENECTDLIRNHFNQCLAEQSFKSPVLHWIVKNRNTRRFQKFIKQLIVPRLLTAILSAIDTESSQMVGNRRILLAEHLSEDAELIADLLADASTEEATDLAYTLLHNQGFETLTKKSLLARFIKRFPSIQKLVSGEASSDHDEQLIVSEESLEARKREYEALINKKIPENKKAIAIAREHGDLKENSEYKMARQDQEILLSRKTALEQEMARARVTDFSDASRDTVSIGSLVEVLENASQKTYRYCILGAWDSDPDNNILSYKTPISQSFLHKKIGDVVTTHIADVEQTWTIKKIERWVDVAQLSKR